MLDVSVVLLTYNQKDYVNQAIDSILSQQFKGSWELIIGDDCSNDGTFDIISSIEQLKLISSKVYSNQRNLGLSRNYEKAILKAKGKYIAYLEGDDYWTDSLKLQKQFDALESNSEYSMAFHDFIYHYQNNGLFNDSNLKNTNLRKNREISEMVVGCLIHQNTIMFRNCFRKLPIWFFLSRNHDTWLLAYLSNWGPALYVECEPLIYRIIDKSLWSSLSPFKKHFNGFITILTIFPITPIRHHYLLLRKLNSKLYQMIKFILK